jgi:lysophospholipase L1-like esterase
MINIVSMSSGDQIKGKLFTGKRVIIILLISNLASIFLLLNIHHNISNVKKQRAQRMLPPDSLRFDENPVYTEQTGLFDIYKKHQAAIVMLGSSFTQRVHWNELLEREDVANRGIGSDVTEGYLHRLQDVIDLQPAVCFIEAGANDIVKGRPLDSIYAHIALLASRLQQKIPLVVVSSCFFVTAQFEGYESFNRKADSLNQMLHNIPQIKIIDINPLICSGNTRESRFAQSDGIHLSASAYLIWKNEIEKVLSQINFSAK